MRERVRREKMTNDLLSQERRHHEPVEVESGMLIPLPRDRCQLHSIHRNAQHRTRCLLRCAVVAHRNTHLVCVCVSECVCVCAPGVCVYVCVCV